MENNANDSFGKGFHLPKDHMLNHLTGRCPRKSLQLNEEAGYKSAIAGTIFRDFAWHLKRGEKASLSLTL